MEELSLKYKGFICILGIIIITFFNEHNGYYAHNVFIKTDNDGYYVSL